MPLFSDLSNISHYYSGGSSSLNYLAGPYAGHSSIVAANYRAPPPSFSKPTTRMFNRGYKPHLATISENQITRSGLSRINSPKMLYHSSPKYKFQKPISINTADIDVSSNRYNRRTYDKPKVPSPRNSTTSARPKTPERTPSFKENSDEDDPEGFFMPRIDKNFRSTIKRERTVVRLHTIHNLDNMIDDKTQYDESPSKRERRQEEEKKIETVKIFDEEIKKPIPKWRENFDPDELKPNRKRVNQKPLSEKYVEKFLIKDKQDEFEDLSKVTRDEEILNNKEENDMNGQISRRNSVRQSVPKVPSFHDICKTISSEKIDEDLNPGSQIVRRNTRKLSNYDVMKQIRRNSAEVNHEEIKILDELIKEENLDKKVNNEQPTQNIENEIPEETDVKKRKKFTKKKSNEKLVDEETKEEKVTPTRRKIVKKKTTGSLDKAIEAITPKDSKISEESNKKIIPKISGTVEVDSKPNLKLVVDKIHVEETILSSSSPTTKKFKYNVTVEEVVTTPTVEKTEMQFNNEIKDKSDSNILSNKDNKISSKLKIEPDKKTTPSEINKDLKKSNTTGQIDLKTKSNVDLNKKPVEDKPKLTKAEEEKQNMLDKILGKKSDTTKIETKDNKDETKQTAEEEKQKMLDKTLGKKSDTSGITNKDKKDEPKLKAEEEKQKMLDKILNKNSDSTKIETKDNKDDIKQKAEEEKQKMLDKILNKKSDSNETETKDKKDETKLNAEEEKQKMLDKILGKKAEPIKIETKDKKDNTEQEISDQAKKAEEEKNKMLDKLLGKKENTTDTKLSAEEEKQKMLDKILGKKPEVTATSKKIEEEKNVVLAKEDDKTNDSNKNLITNKFQKKAEIEANKIEKQVEQKNKINEAQNKLQSNNKFNLIKPKEDTLKSNIISKLDNKTPKKEPIQEIPKSASGAKKQLQKQDSVEDFWDTIGKRETVYYSNRRKYLEERREKEKQNICWTPEWAQETEESHPYSISNAAILEKSRLSDARLRQKLAEMDSVDSIDKPEEQSKIKEIENNSNQLKQKLPEKKPVETKLKESASAEKLKITELKKPEIPEKSKTSSDILKLQQPDNSEKLKALQQTIAQKKMDIAEKSKAVESKVKATTEQNKNKTLDEKVQLKSEAMVDKSKPKPAETIQKKTEISDKTKSKTTEVINKLKSPETKPLEKQQKAEVPKQKQKIKKYPQKPETTELPKTQSSIKSNDRVRPPKLSVKQKSEEKIEKKIRPRLQRQSKSLEHPQKEKIKLTPLEVAEMRAIVREIKLEPIKPELDFIIKEEFDPCLKPNEDLLVPTASQYKKIKPQLDERDKKKRGEDDTKEEEEKKEQEDDENNKDKFVPLQSNFLALPDAKPKPKPKPKWFDECPVVIMATPRDLRKRNPVHRRKQPEPVPKVTYVSDSDDETETSDEESSSTSSGGSDEFETNIVFDANQGGNKWKSTSSNDSGFDSSAPGSPANKRNRNDDCDVNCHKKCEKLTANLCGVNQKLIVEALSSVKKVGSSTASTSSSSDTQSLTPAINPAFTLEPMEMSSAYSAFQRSGRVTPPATSIPRFRKYTVEDFVFLKVLGKGSFGKVLLAELRNTEYYYAVKCLKKDIVLEDDDVECTLIERKVLALGTKHPYLCHLFCTFQTDSHLFFVMEYLNGGDLMFHIQVSGRFPEPRGKFYGAEIVSGLKFLHNKGIVYRDLKLDNILLDFDGHVRIADFGMCKLQIFLDRTADTFCGTPDYMAPEIIKGQHYNQGVDWWSFGVLLYEMLIGQSPFSGCDEDELFWSICNERPVIPAFLSKEASQILMLLLEKDSSKRLGNRYCAAGDIKDQPFFRDIDWIQLEARQLEPPFKPKVQHPLDTQYFDKAFTAEKVKLTPIEKDILHSMDQTQFHGFSYTNPNATDK